MEPILNALEQVLRSQQFTRQVHNNNKTTLNIIRAWCTSDEKPSIDKTNILRCVNQIDSIIANCTLTDYDHEFLFNGLNSIRDFLLKEQSPS